MHILIKSLYMSITLQGLYNIFNLFCEGLYIYLISFRWVLVVNDKGFLSVSFLSLITVFYFIEVDHWIKPKGFIPGRRLAIMIGC